MIETQTEIEKLEAALERAHADLEQSNLSQPELEDSLAAAYVRGGGSFMKSDLPAIITGLERRIAQIELAAIKEIADPTARSAALTHRQHARRA
jgi:hypothetical protein